MTASVSILHAPDGTPRTVTIDGNVYDRVVGFLRDARDEAEWNGQTVAACDAQSLLHELTGSVA